ncbi:hypothetical protein ACFJGV_15090 [Cnuibacter sp. UC19_7]|uniref:hypothetical protein n=1 Tax=Cnuibacter sp. UC19_7 TaxID=3350166 RepID=UPI00366D5688
MQKPGFSLQIGFPSRWGGLNRESFGPVPGHFVVALGGVYRPGPTLFDRIREEEEQAEFFVNPDDVPADVAAQIARLTSSAKDSYVVSFFGSERAALEESAGYTLLERELPVISTLYEWRSGVKLMLIRNELLAEYRADGIDPLNSNDAKLHHFAVPKTREQLDGDPRLGGSV